MSEAKDFRPRLNAKEIQFLIKAVNHYLTIIDIKERQFKALSSKVSRLHMEFRRTSDLNIFKEWKRAREELEAYGNTIAFKSKLIQHRSMCKYMRHRLESIKSGGKAHRHWGYTYRLNEIVS